MGDVVEGEITDQDEESIPITPSAVDEVQEVSVEEDKD
jgi:hypothetical protein